MKLLMENWREFLVEGVIKPKLPYENPDDLLHKVFGLQPSEKEGKLKSLFRQLALQYHPDRNPNKPELEEKFKEINQAYDAVKNPQKYKWLGSGAADPASAYDRTQGAGASASWAADARSAFRALREQEQNDLKNILKKLQQGEGIWFEGSKFPNRRGAPEISKSEQLTLINFQRMDKHPYTALKKLIDGDYYRPGHRGVLWKFVSIFNDKLPVGSGQISDEWQPFIEWLELIAS